MAVTTQELVEMIDQATTEIEVCVPSTDFYRRDGDWVRRTITYVDAEKLVELLRGGA